MLSLPRFGELHARVKFDRLKGRYGSGTPLMTPLGQQEQRDAQDRERRDALAVKAKRRADIDRNSDEVDQQRAMEGAVGGAA